MSAACDAALERSRAELALRDSEERLRRAMHIATVGVMFFDLQGRDHRGERNLRADDRLHARGTAGASRLASAHTAGISPYRGTCGG